MGGQGKSGAYLFSKENNKKIAFCLHCSRLCFPKDSEGAGRGKCNKASYSQQREKLLLLLLPGAGPANTSCSQPQLPAAFWWQKCTTDLSRPGILLPSRRQGTCTGRVVWGPVSHPSWTRLPSRPCRAILKFSFLQKKALFCARKEVDKQTLCFERSNLSEMRHVSSASLPHGAPRSWQPFVNIPRKCRHLRGSGCPGLAGQKW